MSCGSKDTFKNALSHVLVSTHHDVTDLVNHGMEKYKNLNILRTEHNFSTKKKILNLCLGWHILRSYRLVKEVTFTSIIHLSLLLLLSLKHIFCKLVIAQIGATPFMFIFYFLGL